MNYGVRRLATKHKRNLAMVGTVNQSTLVVFCKRPALGQGKQRLAAEIGQSAALIIAEALLNCAVADMAVWTGKVVISPAFEQDKYWAQELLDGASIYPQPEGNLGERIQAIDQELRADGHQKLIFIGTDSPLMQLKDLQVADDLLNESDVVLQPAFDGGVTLMANRKPWPTLTTMPWSENSLCQSLTAKCLVAKQVLNYLEIGYDVDTSSDLRQLLPRLRLDYRATRQALAGLVDDLAL